jgi:translocator assembly and maintenance protein 41
MLAAPTRSTRVLAHTRALTRSALAANPHAESHSTQPAPPPHYAPASSSQAPSPSSTPTRRTRLSPAPRPAPPLQHSTRIPVLPPQFGRNQVLAVPDRTRALLEEIVAGFNAPVRYAFAYGSGVFGQDGYKDSVSVLFVRVIDQGIFHSSLET